MDTFHDTHQNVTTTATWVSGMQT